MKNPQFTDQRDLFEVSRLLMEMNGLHQGRYLVWLFNDGSATDNRDVIQRWLRAEVWRRQTNGLSIELFSLNEALRERLQEAAELYQ